MTVENAARAQRVAGLEANLEDKNGQLLKSRQEGKELAKTCEQLERTVGQGLDEID